MNSEGALKRLSLVWDQASWINLPRIWRGITIDSGVACWCSMSSCKLRAPALPAHVSVIRSAAWPSTHSHPCVTEHVHTASLG